jgi:probable rRNA maturation factor
LRVSISNLQKKIKLDLRQIERDSLRALRLLRLQRAELSIVFVSPSRMRGLNRRYRRIDRSTDVLSFPMFGSPGEFPKKEAFLLGDIVIDPSRAWRDAEDEGLSMRVKFRWLIAHGLLHMLGYDHEGSARAERRMRKKERELLNRLDEA